jgi:hypothetical protein
MGAKRCCLHILNYRQIFENLYFLIECGARCPDKAADYQRSTVCRPFCNRIGVLADGWRIPMKYFP